MKHQEEVEERTYALPGGTVKRSLVLLARGIADQRRSSVIAILASSVYGAAVVASGWGLGQITDRVILPLLRGEQTDSSAIWWAGAFLAVIGTLTAAGVALRRIFAGMATLGVQANHRRVVTRQYVRLPMSWHRRHPTGQLLSNAHADAEAAADVFNPLPFALGVMVMIVMASAAMLHADPVIGAIGVSVLPLILIVNGIYRARMTPAITKVQAERARVADVAHESFDAATTVKALGIEHVESRRFAAATDDLRTANVKVGQIRSVFDPVIDLLPALATLAVLTVGALRARAGDVEVGDIITAAYLLTVMAFPVRAIGFVLGDLPRSLVGHDRIARVADARGYLEQGSAQVPGTGGLTLRLRGVDLDITDERTRPPRQLLHGINLTVPAGATVAIVGATGSGKTTLMDLVARLSDPTRGTITYDHIDARDLTEESRTRAIAYVPQTSFIFDDTIRGNVDLEGAHTRDQIDQALRAAQASDFVSRLPEGIDTVVGERGASLSGGQRQRIAIARALVRRPRLLILDDATSAVDPVVEQRILAVLREMSEAATVLLVAYRTSTIALADWVVHIEGGRIVDTGPHEALLRRDPRYADIVTAYARDRAERQARS